MTRWLVGFSLAMLAGCSEDAPPSPPVRPVMTAVVSAPSAPFQQFAGSIQARYESTLGFRVSGRIARRSFDVGESVRAGQLVAALDPADQDNALRSRQGQTADAESQWYEANADAQRQQQLFAQGVGSRSQLDQAMTRLHTLEASREQARSAERQARDQRSYAELYSDFAGVITAWEAEVGQVVTAGQPMVRIARPDVREAVLDLPPDAVDSVKVGSRLDVHMALEPSLHAAGQVREIEPQADATTRTRRIRVTLVEPPAALRIGALVQGQLQEKAPLVGLPLPVQAIRYPQEGQASVWVIETQDERWHVRARPVTVLREAEGQAWIGQGLREGERVVVAGVNSLQEGQVVKDPTKKTQGGEQP